MWFPIVMLASSVLIYMLNETRFLTMSKAVSLCIRNSFTLRFVFSSGPSRCNKQCNQLRKYRQGNKKAHFLDSDHVHTDHFSLAFATQEENLKLFVPKFNFSFFKERFKKMLL